MKTIVRQQAEPLAQPAGGQERDGLQEARPAKKTTPTMPMEASKRRVSQYAMNAWTTNPPPKESTANSAGTAG